MRLDICALAVAFCFFSPVLGLFSITSSIFGQAAYDTDADDCSIKPGVVYSLLDTAFSFLGVNNQGRFYLTGSASDSTSVEFGGDAFVNSGITSCDSSRSKSSSYFSITPSVTFKNTGKMFLGLGDVVSSALGFTITASSSWSNSGMIVLKSLSNPCSAKLGGTTISNEGSICLYKTFWSHSNSISGSGCIAIHAGSTFTTSASGSTIPSSQVILLGSASSSFNINGFATSFGSLLGGSIPTYNVAGFGSGNKIVVDFLFRSYNYNSNTGILTLVGLLNKVSLNIGKGYDSNAFQADSSLLGLVSKGICYTKAPPNNTPSRCACEPQFPTAPSSTVSSSTSSAAATTLTTAKTSTLSTATPATSSIIPSSTSKIASSTSSSIVPSSTSTSSSQVIPSSTSSSTTVVSKSSSSSSAAAATTSDPGDDTWT